LIQRYLEYGAQIMRPSSQILWYWARGLFFAGVVGWLIVYTGVSFLMSILVAICLEFASIPEPYFRSTEGETISVPLLISQLAGLLVWAAYAWSIWKDLVRVHSIRGDKGTLSR
jgi:hypothetical protein